MKKLILTIALVVAALIPAGAQQRQLTGHVDVTALASAVRTATTNSSSLYSKAFRGVALTLNVSAASGTTPTLDVKLQGFDTISSQWVDISGAAFQRITTTGVRSLTVYPSPEGPGTLRSITGTDPAAGAEISETVTANARWRLISFRASLVTDATVANRRMNLNIDDGTNTLLLTPPASDQAATLTYIYQASNYGTVSNFLSTTMALPLPSDLILHGGYRIRSSTNSLQAGDNWGAPQYLVEEYTGNYSAMMLPRVWRVVATIAGGTPSFTFSVAGSYLP